MPPNKIACIGAYERIVRATYAKVDLESLRRSTAKERTFVLYLHAQRQPIVPVLGSHGYDPERYQRRHGEFYTHSWRLQLFEDFFPCSGEEFSIEERFTAATAKHWRLDPLGRNASIAVPTASPGTVVHSYLKGPFSKMLSPLTYQSVTEGRLTQSAFFSDDQKQ